jgi:hypothetical protein
LFQTSLVSQFSRVVSKLNEFPSSAHRFDALSIFVVVFPCNNNLPARFLSNLLAIITDNRRQAAAAAWSVANFISPSPAETVTVWPGRISPRKSFMAMGF